MLKYSSCECTTNMTKDHSEEKTLWLRHWHLDSFPSVSSNHYCQERGPSNHALQWQTHSLRTAHVHSTIWLQEDFGVSPGFHERLRWACSWSPEPGFQAEGPWVGPRLLVSDFGFFSCLWGIRMPALLPSELRMWMWKQRHSRLSKSQLSL